MSFLRRKRDSAPDEPTDLSEDTGPDTADDTADDVADESDDVADESDGESDHGDSESDDSDSEDSDEDDGSSDDEDEYDDDDDDESAGRKPKQRRGLRAWLKAEPKEPEHVPDYAVRVATLPDLEHFPEDGHVHPEIVRSWMALQQFGEAMLLVSWFRERPAGYVMVSWTGDWDDAIRKEYKDVPSITNLWVDEEHADQDVERKLLEAALTVIEKQGKRRGLISVDREDKPTRRLYRDLGFADTKHRTRDAYVYRDSEGKKRRGVHKNLVLVIDFDKTDEDGDDEDAAAEPQVDEDVQAVDPDEADEPDEVDAADEGDEGDETDAADDSAKDD